MVYKEAKVIKAGDIVYHVCMLSRRIRKMRVEHKYNNKAFVREVNNPWGGHTPGESRELKQLHATEEEAKEEIRRYLRKKISEFQKELNGLRE